MSQGGDHHSYNFHVGAMQDTMGRFGVQSPDLKQLYAITRTWRKPRKETISNRSLSHITDLGHTRHKPYKRGLPRSNKEQGKS